jgi:hypothetical protein
LDFSLGPLNQNSAKKQHGSKESGSKSEITDRKYMLKETKAKFSRNTDTPLCELCYEETEDVKHFLLICPLNFAFVSLSIYFLSVISLLLPLSLLPCCFLALFSRLGASFQKVGVVSLGISKLTEDAKHFLLICPTLNDIREEHLYTLKCYLNNIQEGAYEAICENKQLIQLILDQISKKCLASSVSS